MTLIIGEKVIYPCQGPCLIGAVVKRIIDDRPVLFYQLLVLNNGGGDLFVPVDNAQSIGIRPLLKEPEIAILLERLKRSTQSSDNFRQRAVDNQKLLASGSAFDLAEVVESLTELSETKKLSVGERRTLDRAKKLLICEIAIVMKESEKAAEQLIDEALKSRTGNEYQSHSGREGEA